MNTKYMVIAAAITAMLLAATAASLTSSQFAIAYSRSQAAAQTNDCGNGELPTNIGCQNTACQIQGDENACALASQQSFPGEEVVPPDEVGCPDETVWDITIRGEAEEGGVPIGTVICLFEGLGNHEALVLLEKPITTDVNTNQPNVANCNAPGQQLAEVTSGTPPTPLRMGSDLCATVDLD